MRRRHCNHGGKDWRDVAISKGMLAAARTWQSQEMGSSLGPPDGVHPADPCDFGPMKLILSF